MSSLGNEEEESQQPLNPLLTRTKSFQEAMHKPVSQHIEKLDKNIETMLKDLEYSRQDLQNLKTDFEILNANFLEGNTELNKSLNSEISRIEEFFRKCGKRDRSELDFLGQQMKQLKQDKNKLDETAELLNMRIKECENEVGFRFVYD